MAIASNTESNENQAAHSRLLLCESLIFKTNQMAAQSGTRRTRLQKLHSLTTAYNLYNNCDWLCVGLISRGVACRIILVSLLHLVVLYVYCLLTLHLFVLGATIVVSFSENIFLLLPSLVE